MGPIQPHFYSTKAVAYLRALSRFMIKIGQADAAMETSWVADQISSAHKFLLPAHGRLLAADVGRVNVDIPIEVLRPPFPVTVAEYSQDGTPPGPDAGMTSVRRIILMFDLAKVDIPFLAPDRAERAREHGGIGLLAVFDSDLSAEHVGDEEVRRDAGTDSMWAVAPMMPVILHEQVALDDVSIDEIEADSRRLSAITGQSVGSVAMTNFPIYYWPALPTLSAISVAGMIASGSSPDEIGISQRADSADELRACVDFCISLACRNIHTLDVPAPTALNKKRMNAGKDLLPGYRVLAVKLQPRAARHLEASDAQGVRRSPRQHFRRGHVRRLNGEALTWVSPALVGASNDGVVEKDYLLLI